MKPNERSTTMTKTKQHPLQTFLEDCGDFELRDYSGRAMYGERCLAITGDLRETMSRLMVAFLLAEGLEDDDRYAIERVLPSVRWDSMGLGSVIYFPGCAYAKGEGCDFDECKDAATERRDPMAYCATHAAEHDDNIAMAKYDAAKREEAK